MGMQRKQWGVGIVGLRSAEHSPSIGWASWSAMAHVPALRSLSEDFQIVGVANSNAISAARAARDFDIPQGFASVEELIRSPSVDVVVVTVIVPRHFPIVKAAIDAGKAVYCEWTLGKGLAETEALADMSRTRQVLGVVGTQGRFAPQVQYAKKLVADGYVGKVLSTTLTGSVQYWGGQIPEAAAYICDNENQVSLLTIPVGHSLAIMREVLGDVAWLSADLTNRRSFAIVNETGRKVPMTTHDQVLVEGELGDGIPFSLHFRAGLSSRSTGFRWEINGTDGDLLITGAEGSPQMTRLILAGGRGDAEALQTLEIPESFHEGSMDDPVSGNVARIYRRMASDLGHGTRIAPSFEDAVAIHRILAAIEASSANGSRIFVGRPGSGLDCAARR